VDLKIASADLSTFAWWAFFVAGLLMLNSVDIVVLPRPAGHFRHAFGYTVQKHKYKHFHFFKYLRVRWKNNFHISYNIEYFQLRYFFLVARPAEFMRCVNLF